MGLPALSHLQYLTLELLARADERVSGIALRRQLLAAGTGNRSLPAFYQFMDRLVEEGLVSVRKTRGMSSRTESDYRLLRKGQRAMEASRAFYCKESNCE